MTPDQVRRFWHDALRHYGARSIAKGDSALMGTVGWFLDSMGVLDKEDFLNRFMTTIGEVIYRPFAIGDESSGWSLASQVIGCTHELVHVRQYQRDPAGFTLGYAMRRSSRADHEAKAYAAELEVHYWLYGTLYDIRARMQCLLDYGLKQEHCDFAADVLESVGETIKQGASVNEVAAWTIAWLEANGVKPR